MQAIVLNLLILILRQAVQEGYAVLFVEMAYLIATMEKILATVLLIMVEVEEVEAVSAMELAVPVNQTQIVVGKTAGQEGDIYAGMPQVVIPNPAVQAMEDLVTAGMNKDAAVVTGAMLSVINRLGALA